MMEMTDGNNKAGKRPSRGLVFAWGMLLPGLLLLIAYYFIGVWPFGSKLILEVDCVHQYLPFLTEVRRKLVSGESLFYSFSGGGGYNLWATIAYYASCPLNYLLVLVKESSVGDMMVWLIWLKLALCGGTLAWYLYRQEKGSACAAVAFGTMYALSNFFLGYKFNLMWLDSIAMVPPVMAGIENLVRGRKSALYLFSLFYAVWCNYYIGYMVCLFACLWFLLQTLLAGGGVREHAARAGRFALSSLAGGGMGAVLLLPAYLSLRETSSGASRGIPDAEMYNNGLSMLRAQYADTMAYRTSYERGDVQLYCGLIVLLLAVLFLLNRAVRRRERIGYGALLAFLAFSFTFSPLNFIWHGFHLEMGLPNRFAFLFMIVLIRISYTALSRLKEMSWTRLAVGCGAVLLGTAAWAAAEAVTAGEWTMFLCLGMLALYAGALFLMRSGLPWKSKVQVALCCVMAAEAGGHGLYDLINKGGYEQGWYVSWQTDYQRLMDEMGDGDDFFRSEIDSTHIVNFVSYVGGRGVTFFNSTFQQNIRDLYTCLNLYTGLNTAYYKGASRLMSDLLGVRYILTTQVSGDTWNGFERIAELHGKYLYYNPDALSVGFLVDSDIVSWEPNESDGLDVQNEFVRLACGGPELFTVSEEFTGASGETYEFAIPDGGMLYLDPSGVPESIEWTTPEFSQTYTNRPGFMLAASSTGEGQHVSINLVRSNGGNWKGLVYTSEDDDYREVIRALSDCQLEDVRFAGNTLTGDIAAYRDGVLLLTVPYNEGWSLTVDGAPRQILKIGGAWMGVPLSSGWHDISMTFVPRGFTVGAAASLLCLALTVCVMILECRKKKQMPAGNGASPREEAAPPASESIARPAPDATREEAPAGECPSAAVTPQVREEEKNAQPDHSCL